LHHITFPEHNTVAANGTTTTMYVMKLKHKLNALQYT